MGEPFHVPAGGGDAVIEEARRSLEERLKALEQRARDMLFSPQRPPGTPRSI
jgi:hypothetical protein